MECGYCKEVCSEETIYLECSHNLCQACSKILKDQKIEFCPLHQYKKRIVVVEKNQSELCPEHKRPINAYCTKTYRLLCDGCMLETDARFKHSDYKSIEKKILENFSNLLKKSKDIVKNLGEKEQNIFHNGIIWVRNYKSQLETITNEIDKKRNATLNEKIKILEKYSKFLNSSSPEEKKNNSSEKLKDSSKGKGEKYYSDDIEQNYLPVEKERMDLEKVYLNSLQIRYLHFFKNAFQMNENISKVYIAKFQQTNRSYINIIGFSIGSLISRNFSAKINYLEIAYASGGYTLNNIALKYTENDRITFEYELEIPIHIEIDQEVSLTMNIQGSGYYVFNEVENVNGNVKDIENNVYHECFPILNFLLSN